MNLISLINQKCLQEMLAQENTSEQIDAFKDQFFKHLDFYYEQLETALTIGDAAKLTNSSEVFLEFSKKYGLFFLSQQIESILKETSMHCNWSLIESYLKEIKLCIPEVKHKISLIILRSLTQS